MAQPTPEQSFKFYKARLTEVLLKHNPSGLKTVDSLLNQFPGKEYQVYSQICKMAKIEPLPPAAPAEIMEFPLGVSQWLIDHGFNSYAHHHQLVKMTMKDFMAINSKGKLIEIGVLPKHADPLLTEILRESYVGSEPLPESEPVKPMINADFKVGENCFAKMMLSNSKGGEKWVNAKVTHVNDDNTFDIFVCSAASYGVSPDAVNVPRKMLKKSTEDVEVAIPDPKRKNTKRPQFQQGDRIRVSGLRTHLSYNGLCGTVLLYVPTERRYQIRLDTNDVIAIKQKNVRALKKQSEPMSDTGKKQIRDVHDQMTDDAMLPALMVKLMQDNPDTDAGKLGEFAAGYLLSKKKLIAQKAEALPSNIA